MQKKVFAYVIDIIMKGLHLKTYKQSHTLMLVYETQQVIKANQKCGNYLNLETQQDPRQNRSKKYESECVLQEKLLKEHFYEVVFDERQQKWVCECGISAKRGLPCEHQAVICIRYKQRLEKQIGIQWTRQEIMSRADKIESNGFRIREAIVCQLSQIDLT